jgi:phosphohistidine phosphatase
VSSDDTSTRRQDVSVRTLYLLRHAKSSWSDPSLGDRERPLAPRGRRAAKRMALYINSQDIRPELVLCSSAQRARETLEVLRPALGPGAEVRFDDDLYGANAYELLGRLRAVNGHIASVLLVGHNPGLQDLATSLAGDGEPVAKDLLEARLPTGALAVLDLGSTTWARLGPGGAYLVRLVLPRELPVEPDERPG